MNRIIFFIILLGLTSINLSAQKISVDRIEEDGSHQIMTNTMDFYVGERIYSFGMKVFETTHSNNWLLLISSKFNISNNCKVLFKLGNGEILYIPVNNVHIGKIKKPAYGVTIGNITTFHPETEIEHYSSVYELSETDMDKIDTHGIKKIRISNGSEIRDKTYTNNPLGKFLTRCRKIIKKRMENPITPKNLFDDLSCTEIG